MGDYFTATSPMARTGGITMASITTSELVAAGIGAGAVLLASIPVWVSVAQVRKRRLKDDINDAVNAKIGDLVGGAFTNLLALQRNAETKLNALLSDLESRASMITKQAQGELDTALSDARNTMRDLQAIAAKAKESASEIDEVKATAQEHGVDLDTLFDNARARQELEMFERLQTLRADRNADLKILIEESDKPEGERDADIVAPLYKKYHTKDLAATLDAAILAVRSAERDMKVWQEAIAQRRELFERKRREHDQLDELEESGPEGLA